jgi:anthranilate phosphoribosyltransferase
MKENIHVIDFIKKVGKGKTLSSHLNEQESRLAMEGILSGAFSDAQLGAFLQALRIQELEQQELDGLLETCYTHMNSLRAQGASSPKWTLNVSSDTPRKGGLLSLLAVGLLEKMGKEIGVVRSTPMLSGNTSSFEITHRLVQKYFPSPLTVAECGTFLTGLNRQDRLRKELGFRSCLHTLEKLLNPWKNDVMLLGISHKKYAERMLRSLKNKGHRRARIVLGNHGTVDLAFHKRTVCLDLIDTEDFQMKEVEPFPTPEELGFSLPTSLYAVSQFENWDTFLEDKGHPIWHAVAYQGAFLLSYFGEEDTPKEPKVLYEMCLDNM